MLHRSQPKWQECSCHTNSDPIEPNIFESRYSYAVLIFVYPCMSGAVNEMLMPELVKNKPPKTAGVHVSFRWRSKEAQRLVECGAAGRPLLTLDGVPLHSHPSLQLMQLPAGHDEESIEKCVSPFLCPRTLACS